MPENTPPLDKIVRRVTGLYSLPAVAMEVVQLTNQPHADAEALTRCLERDPALTVKVLKVVNSSLFGLSGEVADLNQAIALLGMGPLKLLVLGFSLPEELFDGARKEQLEWYWTNSLTRAVAARQLSQVLWHSPGNEAFLAALLQDIGLLALLRELDEAFAEFLNKVIVENHDLTEAEKGALGFDHRQLSVAMLRDWNLPEVLTESIEISELPLRLARMNSPAAEIAKVLHLADLLAQLVGQNRISVLPELLEVGQLYCDLTKKKLHQIVADLQPTVDQLAELLSLELLPHGKDYDQILAEAHKQLVTVAEEAAGPLAALHSDDAVCEALLAESSELQRAMEAFLEPAEAGEKDGNSELDETGAGPPDVVSHESKQWNGGHAAHERTAGERENVAASINSIAETEALAKEVMLAARGCRMRRSELSLLMLEIDRYQELVALEGEESAELVIRTLEASSRGSVHDNATFLRIAPERFALVLADCDRRQALGYATEIVSCYDRVAAKSAVTALTDTTLSGAVATMTSIFKNFSSDQLINGAERCLISARAAGGTAVKSIEVH